MENALPTLPFAPFDDASVLSSSKLFEAPDGVLEPVRVGDCSGDSLIGEGNDAGETTRAFSLPVTASDIARRPMMRGFFADFRVCRLGRGDSIPLEGKLSGFGDGVTGLMSGL